MKKYLYLFTFIIIFCFSSVAYANTVEEFKMDVYIENDGDALITEQWKYKSNSNTEIYHAYKDLGNSQIRDLEVWRDGQKYETVYSWNIDGSFEYKKNKCGIYRNFDSVEICWGIGEYGTHKYEVSYTIENFVKQLNDSQLIYWELLPASSEKRKDVKITIHSDKYFEDTTDVWGFGNYGGLAYVYDGRIEMDSEGDLNNDEYMTILVKLPKDMFNTSDKINKNFDYYLEMAQEGSKAYKENFVLLIIAVVFQFALIFIFIVVALCGSGSKGRKINKKLKEKDIEFYRDIPCSNDIFKAYFIAYEYNIITKKTDLLGAIILKWIKEKRVYIQNREVGTLRKREEQCIVFEKEYEDLEWDIFFEKELYSMMYMASKDGILEKKELEKWCEREYKKLFNWFEKILDVELQTCIKYGEINEIKKATVFSKGKYSDTPMLEEQARQIFGLKKYLKEFSVIDEREPIEVMLFEEYLIYAQMLGIAKTVANKFKDLYPELLEQSSITYNDYMFTNSISTRAISSASTARQRANSYSGGGGGFSSGGGGGGSFGGGGSMGSR